MSADLKPVPSASSGAGGTQYTEGDVDASITGTAGMMEGAGNTLVPMQGTAADGQLVNLGANNDVTITSGAVTETNSAAIKTAVETIDNFISGARGLVTEDNSAAMKTALELIDNAVAGAGFNITQQGGVAVSLNTGVRDAGTQRVTIATDDTVQISGSVTATVSGLTNTQYTEDVAAATDPVGTATNVVRDDYRAGNITNQNGDNVALRGTNAGELYVKHVDTMPVAGAVTASGERVPLVQIEGSNETATYDTNLARVLGTQPLLDLMGRLPVVASGSVGVLPQRAGTLEQTTYDTGLNPVLAALLAAVQAVIVTQQMQAPNGARLRVQQEMSDMLLRLQEQTVLTALQTEWDTLETQDYQMNMVQSVNGGTVGYGMAQGQSGMSCYLLQEVR